MVPALLAGYFVDVMAGCREDPLPTPLIPCIGIFALKCIRESDSAQASFKVALMLSFYQIKMLAERFFRTNIWLLAKSISFTRRRKHSISRKPDP